MHDQPKGQLLLRCTLFLSVLSALLICKGSWISGFLNENPQFSNTENDLKIKKKKICSGQQNVSVFCGLPLDKKFTTTAEHGLIWSQTSEQEAPGREDGVLVVNVKSQPTATVPTMSPCSLWWRSRAVLGHRPTLSPHHKNETRRWPCPP